MIMNKTLHIFSLILLLVGAAANTHAQNTDQPQPKSPIQITGNIYGGGEMAKVAGNTNVTVNDGSLGADIFGGGEGKLKDDGTVSMSADVSGDTHVTINGGEFAVEPLAVRDPHNDKPFKQHYNIYGGGNIASAVGETHVYVTKGMISNTSANGDDFLDNDNPNGIAYAYYREGQMYFCIFGGGFGKNTSVTGNTWVDFNINGMTDINSTAIEDDLLEYQSYLDVIGGGFNGTVQGNTNVHVGGNAMCRNVYGGGLYATIGTQDDAEKGKTNVHITGGNVDNVYGGGVMGDIFTSTNVNIGLKEALSFEGRDYAVANDKVTILMSVYGGNDVSGKVPTANINHFGGTVDQNIFGAGNGDYIGYYTPGLCDYAEGENDNYYVVDHSGDTSTDGKGTKGPKGNTYKGRPQTGNVNITIAGNSTENKASVLGQVFGGGNSCTVGAWETNLSSKYDGDPHKWRDDPDYFKGGGKLNITLGSHIKIGRTHAELAVASDEDKEAYLAKGENVSGLYMGCSGRNLATQGTAAESNSYHHYYDHYTAKYYPGFAVFADNGTPLSREDGLKSFNAYLNNILVWSDNVNLNIADNVEDVWLSNFVGGGFRGSMKAKTAEGQFHYSLPRGVTIGHDIVGGAYNTDVVYRVYDTADDMHTYKMEGGHYTYRTDIKSGWTQGTDYHHIEYAEDSETITGIIRFYYDGGVLSHDNNGSRRHGVFTAYGSGDDNVIDFSGFDSGKGLRKHNDKALVYIDARCQLEPEIIDGKVHGGNVFGGCFESGTIDGDVWTDYRAYIAPKWYGNDNFNGGPKMFANAADYLSNFAMMAFGAGYGKNTSIKGDVYLRVIYNKENSKATYPCLYNVFGGSFQGTVDGNTNIYYNAGAQGLTVGGIYGGGSQGYVAGKSFVELAGGYIANVYGGAREANVGKGTHVWAYDGKLRNWADDLTEHDDAPLVIERMFGGSDVSGLIGFKADATDVSDDKGRVADAGWTAHFSTSNWPKELFINGTDATGGLKKFDSYIQIGGTDHSERGYPLVGQIYAGGNGENTDTDNGQIVPGIDYALIELSDGNVIEAFGGGNAATIHKQNYILTNGTNAPVNVITMPNSHLTQIMQQRVLRHAPDCYTLSDNTFTFKPHHVQRLFGGNNVATMAIQPKWNLKQGYLGSVYSGGNEGDMTYYNADAASGESKGLSITIDSKDIHIESLYGGCRMSDVKATLYGKDSEGNITETPQTFADTEYGATVNVLAGHIGNVYGGNDVSGYVYNGTNVNLSGSITGNVYGAGNGDYLYAYDKKNEYTTETRPVVQALNEDGKTIYWVKGSAANPSALQLLTTINNARPHVAKAYLNVQGQGESNKVYISGSVYCGGNASTIRPKDGIGNDAKVKFNIGNNVIANQVFMGSDGESMKYVANDKNNTFLTDFEKVNGLDFSANITETDWTSLTGDDELKDMDATLRDNLYPNLLSVYMRAVDMKAMPEGFTDEFSQKEFTNTWIGTFCMGGNAGSMMVDQPVDIVFPQSLKFFGRIIGGSMDASFQYKGKWHRGGFRVPLASDAKLDGAATKTKLRMKIRGDWYSRRMVMEDGYKSNDYLAPDKTDDGKTWNPTGKAWGDGCNVYGGCYLSGDMVGDVEIYIESDMLAYSADRYSTTIDTYKNAELEESNKLNLPVANVYGAGYGPESRSFGDAYIYMKDIPNVDKDTHPSVNNIFGGGRNGLLVGNSVIHVHDGLVFKDVVGGSFAAPMYGSSQVTIGYPKFYICKKTGEYSLDRADKWNDGYKGKDGKEDVIKKSVKYFEGEYVPCNVYDQITGVKLHGSGTITDLAGIHTTERSNNTYFDFHNEYDNSADNPENFFPKGGWDNVEIRVRGGVYGGGFLLSNSTSTVAGSYTTLACTEEYNHGTASIGYGGNSSIIIADQGTTKDHIKISSENPVENGQYSGTGGIYGDGRLVFCQGFRAAEINGYGYAEHTPSNPLMLNSLQRFDLLTVNDCCLKLYGDQDFATDELNSQKYSLARIGELRMNSSINADGNLAQTKSTIKATSDEPQAQDAGNEETPGIRNYIGFYNNIHYLGAIVTNDDFSNTKFHDATGAVDNSNTYLSKKQWYIDQYYNKEDDASVNAFKERNYATARNMVGINSGYCLRVENLYYNGGVRETYYGPIVGVAEVKLLNVQPGEGGGYVYADNIHAENNPTFMNVSGNFVFEGVVRPDETEKQLIIDDCLPKGFSELSSGEPLPEQHYWYVIGNTYYYNSTLTAFTYNGNKTFSLINSDPNVIFAGIEDGSEVSLQSVKWQEAVYPDGYTSDIRGGNSSLAPISGNDTYKFTLQVGNNTSWSADLPRTTSNVEAQNPATDWTPYSAGSTTPRFNVLLDDNVNNCPLNGEETYYNTHLSVPEKVLLIIKARKKDGEVDGVPTYETKTYNVTLDIVYLQGPSFTGNVNLLNCALPGERIGFNSKDIQIKTTDQLPVTGYGWKLVPLKNNLTKGTYDWDATQGTAIPQSCYKITPEGYLEGSIPALYSQNHWNVLYTFNAGGEEFTVAPTTDSTKPLNERMLEVHNYHKMADIATKYDVSLATGADAYAKALKPGAMIYLADAADIAAFVSYINAGNATDGMHFIMQNDLTLPAAITGTFAGTLHGDGYSLTLPTKDSSLFGANLTGKVYNLGVPNGKIATVTDASASVINCFTAEDNADDLKYGKKAYDLSHRYHTNDAADGYINGNRYANEDWQYARIEKNDSRMLRIGEPNYGNMQTAHNTAHTAAAIEEHDCLFFGQTLNPSGIASTPYPQHIDDSKNLDNWNEDNRVYRTAGYYQSTTDEGFHYNKRAWAMQPTLTAIDFTAANPETTADGNFYGKTDDRPATLVSFNSDSNASIANYSNENAGKVTQNLLVYNAGEDVFNEQDVEDIAEEDVKYHNVKVSDAKYATDYFHLVDKQDFCAPIQFTVNNRAWYERKPAKYAENSNDAWEGICLPFTVKKAEASLNGEITHFYGTPTAEQLADPAANDKTLHHEYWLRGLVGLKADASSTVANFQRPGAADEEGLFYTAAQASAAFDYTYAANDYLTGLSGYNKEYNDWYTKEHTFDGYKPLTANTPYIVSFPGERFYEFNLTDQSITFSNNDGAVIPVTEALQTSVHNGTFLHVTDAAYGMNDDGTQFSNDVNTVLPFRTYMAMATTSAPGAKAIIIGGTAESLGYGIEELGDPSEGLNGAPQMVVYSRDHNIIIESDYADNVHIYSASGQLVRAVKVYEGSNLYSGFESGVYIINGKKLFVK